MEWYDAQNIPYSASYQPTCTAPLIPAMRTLSIDIETYSPVDLAKAGVYPYAEHPEFEILLFAYAFDDEPVRCVELAQGESLPEEVVSALTDPDVIKTAFNAMFERVCISRFFELELPIEQWECTMVKAAMLGLPLSLAMVAKVLKLEQGKMEAGKALIRYFSLPCKPTKSNGGRTRNLPRHDLDKWRLFGEYCIRDVEVERAIRDKIAFFDIPEMERALYVLDQEINDRGVLLDAELVRNAIEMDTVYKDKLTEEAKAITALDNPNSVAQLKEWVSGKLGEEVESLTKGAIKDLSEETDDETVKAMLMLRLEMAKTSVKKYMAMANAVGADGRVRALLQFYGANRTGRWAGRLVQVQNLPQNHLNDLDLAREVVKSGDLDMLEMLYGNVPDTLSQLIRTAFIAKEGHTFVVADFSAIEARVIAWLAGEQWRLRVFETHGKIYEASASAMFGVPIEEIHKGSPLRQKGKVSELALGYQGGTGALIQMGALKMGLTEDELQPLVDAWRNANPAIVRLWYDVGNAAIRAVETGLPTRILQGGITFEVSRGLLFVHLPSGRKLSYARPRVGLNKFGSKALQYDGMSQTTKTWGTQDTYGGKLVENIVQAIARDCLAYAMINLRNAGYDIVMHIHDEAVSEVPTDRDYLDDVCSIMSQPIPWAKGLPLRADGYVTPYYKKD